MTRQKKEPRLTQKSRLETSIYANETIRLPLRTSKLSSLNYEGNYTPIGG